MSITFIVIFKKSPCQSGPESNGNEEVLHIPQTPGLEFHR